MVDLQFMITMFIYALAFALATKDHNSNSFLLLVFYFLISIHNLY